MRKAAGWSGLWMCPSRRRRHPKPHSSIPDSDTNPKDAKFIWRHQLKDEERKAQFKQLAMRWHPDKFNQKFGPRLCPKESRSDEIRQPPPKA